MGYYGKSFMQYGRAASVGYFIIIAIILGAGGGILVDKWLGSAPTGLVTGFIIGLVAAGRELYVIARTTRFNTPSDGDKP